MILALSGENHSIRCFFIACIVATINVSATVHYTSKYATYQAAIDSAKSGDAVVFDGGTQSNPIIIDRALDDIQFNNGAANWELNADITNCQFFDHQIGAFIQKSGKLRRCAFYMPSYKTRRIMLTHVDSCSFYFALATKALAVSENPKNSAGQYYPQMQLYGFVRGVMVHKPWVHNNTGPSTGFGNDYGPSLRIDATGPAGQGDGRNTYIVGFFSETQRAWTPVEVINGTGITMANICTEQNVWADPVMVVHNGYECMALCNATGARSDAVHAAYISQPDRIQYNDGLWTWGHNNESAPFRGAAYFMGGQKNKSVASGNYKTWSIGIKDYLPGFHFSDGFLARDPFLEYYPGRSGWLNGNLAESKNVFLQYGSLSADLQAVSGYQRTAAITGPKTAGKYPLYGANIYAPVFIKLQPIRTGSSLGKARGPSRVEEIYRELAAGATVRLTRGTFIMNQTITSGELVGEGPDKTVLVFKPGIVCAMGKRFKGFSNLTVKAGTWGYVSKASSISKRFPLTVFDGQSEGGIQINGNTQNDVIQDVVFRNSKVGIACGQFGSSGGGFSGDPFLDRLAITNCTFENLNKGIDLRQDSTHASNGAVSVQNCTFKNVTGTGIKIYKGQTYLVQLCTFDNVATTAGANAVDVNSQGAVAVSHLKVTGTSSSANTAINLVGKGAASHCTVNGFATALSISSDAFEIDNFSADGSLLPGNCEVYIANSKFQGIDGLGKGIMQKADGTKGEVPTTDIKPDVTAPPSVTITGVTKRTGYNLISWTKVSDTESGILQYAIFDKKTGAEIGRTAMATHKKSPFEAEIFMVDTFADANTARAAYTQADYEVKAINGANILSDGTKAPIKRWRHLEGAWKTPEGTYISAMDMSAVTVSGTTISVTAKGNTYSKSQLGQSGTPDFYYLPVMNMRNYCADFEPGCDGASLTNDNSLPSLKHTVLPATRIGTLTFTTGVAGVATLRLFDAAGRQAAVLFSGKVEAGKAVTYSVPMKNLAAGAYIMRLQCGTASASKAWVTACTAQHSR